MRVAVLALILIASGSVQAAEGVAHPAASDGKPHGDHAMNRLCPVDAKPVDRRLQSIHHQLADPVRALWIGTCGDACWEKVSAAPATYAAAVVAELASRERSSGPAPAPQAPALPKDPASLTGDHAPQPGPAKP
jgi:hypothetical protein